MRVLREPGEMTDISIESGHLVQDNRRTAGGIVPRARIMLVEDEANLRASLAFIFEREGFDVIAAATGRSPGAGAGRTAGRGRAGHQPAWH